MDWQPKRKPPRVGGKGGAGPDGMSHGVSTLYLLPAGQGAVVGARRHRAPRSGERLSTSLQSTMKKNLSQIRLQFTSKWSMAVFDIHSSLDDVGLE